MMMVVAAAAAARNHIILRRCWMHSRDGEGHVGLDGSLKLEACDEAVCRLRIRWWERTSPWMNASVHDLISIPYETTLAFVPSPPRPGAHGSKIVVSSRCITVVLW